MKQKILVVFVFLVCICFAQLDDGFVLPVNSYGVAHSREGNFIMIKDDTLLVMRDASFDVVGQERINREDWDEMCLYGNPGSNEFYYVRSTGMSDSLGFLLSYYDGEEWILDMPIPLIPHEEILERSIGYEINSVRVHIDSYKDLWIFLNLRVMDEHGAWEENVILYDIFDYETFEITSRYIRADGLDEWYDHVERICDIGLYGEYPTLFVKPESNLYRVTFDSLYNEHVEMYYSFEDEGFDARHIVSATLWNNDTFYYSYDLGMLNITDSGTEVYRPEHYERSTPYEGYCFLNPDSSAITMVWENGTHIHWAEFDGSSWIENDSFCFGSDLNLLDCWLGPVFRDTLGREWIYFTSANYMGSQRFFIAPLTDFLSIEEQETFAPQRLSITSYPNPFNSSITVEASKAGRFFVYNIFGSLVAELNTVSSNNARWSPDANTESGVYLIKVITTDGEESTRLVSYIK